MDDEERMRQDCIQFGVYRAIKTGDMISAKMRALHRYWDSLRAGRLAPMRSDVDPREMPCDVRNVFLVEALNGANIRFRVAGSGLTEVFGMELRGMNVRSIMAHASRESFNALIAETLEDPGVGYARLTAAHDPDSLWEISLLPLRSDIGAIDRLMGTLVPLAGSASRGDGPLQFRIDHMRVDSIAPTILDAERPAPIAGFAEPASRFEPLGMPTRRRNRPLLQSIEGGLEGQGGRTRRSTAQLRLVED